MRVSWRWKAGFFAVKQPGAALMATAIAQRYTVDEFEALDLGDDRFELWWGEVRPVPGGGAQHSFVGVNVGAELRAFV
jgi:hypothetical protein